MLLVILLIFLSFLQATLLPFNLVLLVLISRSFLKEEKSNYWLAFSFGLLLSFLLNYPLGSLSILYLVEVAIIHFIRRAEFASHWLVVLPLSFVFLLADQFVQSKLLGFSLNFWPLVPQVVLSVPIYLLIRFWEERFIPRADVKLKIRS
ncbi:MAG: hypothetical protein M1142_04120 [Patescibacteria group bacterium]|nr:hypothetical protein [Patescibacteria group bacterium]